LDIAYGLYRAHGFAVTLSEWKKLETTIGKDVTVGLNGGNIEGLAVDVDEHGSLIVELPTGERRAVPAATVVS
jgi:BirA family biotin operon repressor/biotin-[acetyl-CoA-carboxylase] ligase